MKKLVSILFLIPFVGFSQVLIENVSVMSYLDTPKNIHESTQVMSNMSIYIDSGFLIIKDDLETLKYKVTDSYFSDINGKETTVYEILIEDEKYIAYVDSVEKSRFLFLRSDKDTDVSFFYEKKAN